MIYHSLSKDQPFVLIQRVAFPLQAPLFQKGIGKNSNNPKHGTAKVHAWWQIQCHVHCLNIMRFVSSSLTHRSKSFSTAGFPCQTAVTLIVMSSYCQHKGWLLIYFLNFAISELFCYCSGHLSSLRSWIYLCQLQWCPGSSSQELQVEVCSASVCNNWRCSMLRTTCL